MARYLDMGLHQARRQTLKTKTLLIFGPPKSGKSTILNQLNILFAKGFTDQFRLECRPKIYRQFYISMSQKIDV